MIRNFVIPVTRYGDPVAVDGVVTSSVSATFDIRASVQPLKAGEAMQMQEDLRESRENYRVYTDTELLTADTGKQADTVIVFGNEVEVLSVEKWQNGIRPHYKAIISR